MDAQTPTKPLASVVVLGSPSQRALTRVEVPIREPRFTIGRGSNNCLSLGDDTSVSRNHCVIETAGSTLVLRDLDSSNGTYLNGRRMTGAVPLPVPAMVTVGKTRLAVTTSAAPTQQAQQVADRTLCTRGSIVIPSRVKCAQRTEAFLVADLVGSTRLVKEDSARFATIVTAMGRILERALCGEQELFLQCTGDGFFACLGSANVAFDAGLDLAPALARRTGEPLQLSIALHWGSASLTPGGDRTGQDVHAVFALEKLRHSEPALAADLAQPGALGLLLATGRFWQQLDDVRRRQTEPVGNYHLKGLDEPQQVFRWAGLSGG
ncbi:MAG: FHA domain-containing protein [Verrucomicrobia bacterium]|nr:FHA domain-containing protein [Verrucomicrobiota bacterium]